MTTVFQVTVHVAPKNVSRFLEASQPTIEKMKNETELVYFEMYQVHDAPGTITWIEKWCVESLFVGVRRNGHLMKRLSSGW